MKKSLCPLYLLMFFVFASVAAAQSAPPEEGRRDFPKFPELSAGNFRLGILVSEIDEHLKEALKIQSGVLVTKVIEDSPAAKAGIKEGDIILKVDGKQVSSHGDIRDQLQGLDNGKSISVQLLRDGKNLTVSVTPEKGGLKNFFTGLNRNYLGLDVQELDSDLAAYFKVAPQNGVLVTRVAPDSPAAEAGIRSGDIVTEFNGVQIRQPEDLRKQLKDLKEGQKADLTVIRQGEKKVISVTPKTRSFPELGDRPFLPDSEEFEDSMKGLGAEMKRFKDESKRMQLSKEDIEEMKREIEQSLRKELDEIRKEIEELKKKM